MGLVGRGADRFEEVNGSVHGSVFVLSPDSPESQQLQRDKKTIGSETQFGLLMIGVKTPETC